MDCIIENCQAGCLGRCHRWILAPTVELSLHLKSSPSPWVSTYLRRPKRSYKNYLAEKQLKMRMAKASA